MKWDVTKKKKKKKKKQNKKENKSRINLKFSPE